jgi:hypothetical protein
MDHPVVKWTLDPHNGQRQWTNLEANAVLEDLRNFGVWVGSKYHVWDQAWDSDEDDDNSDEEQEQEQGGSEDEGGTSDDDDDDHDEEQEEEQGEQEEQEQGGDEDEGEIIAAGAAVATELGLDIDDEAGEVPPFLGDETMEHLNQDARETEPSNQAEDEDDSVDDPLPDGEEVVVPSPHAVTCGLCSEGIVLDSTFYRCVGHSCRGAS